MPSNPDECKLQNKPFLSPFLCSLSVSTAEWCSQSVNFGEIQKAMASVCCRLLLHFCLKLIQRNPKRGMGSSVGIIHIFWFFIAAGIEVRGQLQTGFISIDCGSSMGYYNDIDTGISYNDDGQYIETGINRNISSEYAYPNNPNLPYPLSDLRSFPEGNKNCYSVVTSLSAGPLVLIRASFLYGNYDGKNNLPEFDLYVDVNLWSSVKFKNASDVFTTEIITTIESNATYVCLLNKGLGTPFISALELRPLNNSIYGTEFGSSAYLVLIQRLDIGLSNGTGRFRDDSFDRIWSFYMAPSWDSISTSSPINVNENGYRVPFQVISTAAKPNDTSGVPLELLWNTTDPSSKFYIYMHFAEVERLQINQSRIFQISWNGSPLLGPFSPRYLYADTRSNSKALTGLQHRISISKANDSTLPPILNAAEIYMVRLLDELPTYFEDVNAMTTIKSTYQVRKFWAGDPCGPKNYSWEGLNCNYSSSRPRIFSLNLTSSNLSGLISVSFAKLSSLEYLDLSNNNLTGPVPEFLGELQSLKFLNLKGNQLSGYIPSVLTEKVDSGLLSLSVDEQNLCGSCQKKKNNIYIPIVASISSVLVLVAVLLILWRLRRKFVAMKKEARHIEQKKRRFGYEEILTITNNFQTMIGKGGFGSVYSGCLEDGTEVAVKKLSASSSQGFKEFQAEAELLLRIHHRNLVHFIGYCDEGENLALIYEYMANGNLRDYLTGRNSHTLSWEMRLKIAVDAAQGLEYLHHGCRPPIVHRDVKSANILLSANLDAKIADFGLSKVFPSDNQTQLETVVMGTTGYLDPEYYKTRMLKEKSDVYSFGIVLLELITGQPAIIKADEATHITVWLSRELVQGNISRVVEKRLQGDYDLNSMERALDIAMACTAPNSDSRPDMGFALAALKECLAMELSRNGERIPRSEEVFSEGTSHEVYYTDSDFITDPVPR